MSLTIFYILLLIFTILDGLEKVTVLKTMLQNKGQVVLKEVFWLLLFTAIYIWGSRMLAVSLRGIIGHE